MTGTPIKRLRWLLLMVPLGFAVYSWGEPVTILACPGFKAWSVPEERLSGGTRDSCEGSSPSKALYSNRGGNTEHSNPMIVDAHGEASIRSAGPVPLRYQTSAEVSVRSMNHVIGIGGSDDNRTMFLEQYGAAGDGKTDDAAAIEAAIMACPATGCRLQLSRTYRLSNEVSIPAKARLVFTGTGMLSVDATQRVTIASPEHITASPAQQIFDGNGLIFFTDPGVVYPEWWQANTPGTTDMAPAINKALVAGGAGSTLQFREGTYLLRTISRCADLPACGTDNYLENYFINLLDSWTIRGTGWGSVLKVADHIYDQPNDDTSNAHVFQGFDIDNVVIRDLQINMNGYNNFTPPGKIRNCMAIRLDDGGSNVLIENLFVLNNPGHNNVVANNTSLASKATGLTVTNCVMYGGGTGVLGNTKNPDFSFLYSEWAHTMIRNNRLEQPEPTYTWSGGIELHRSWSQATDNIISYCDPGVWVASGDQTGAVDLEQVIISGNVMKNCARGVAFWVVGTINNVTVANNAITLMWRGGVDKNTYGIHMVDRGGGNWTDANAAGGPLYNINILDNVIAGEDNDSRYVVFDGHGIYATSVHGLNIKGNKFDNLMGDGVLIVGSPYGLSDLVIQDNCFKNWGRGHSGVAAAAIRIDLSGGPAASWDTTAIVPDAGAFKLRNALITGNVFIKDENSTDKSGAVVSAYPWVVATDDDDTADQVSNVIIRGNIDHLGGVTRIERKSWRLFSSTTTGEHLRSAIYRLLGLYRRTR